MVKKKTKDSETSSNLIKDEPAISYLRKMILLRLTNNSNNSQERRAKGMATITATFLRHANNIWNNAVLFRISIVGSPLRFCVNELNNCATHISGNVFIVIIVFGNFHHSQWLTAAKASVIVSISLVLRPVLCIM